MYYRQTRQVVSRQFTHRRVYTQRLLHTEAFTHRHFYTQHFYTQKLWHTDAFIHRGFYTQMLLHTNVFLLHTHTLSHTQAFTHRHFYTQTLLHADAFTHTHTFTHRGFYTQKLLRRGSYTQTFYTQKLLHTNAFAHRHFYPQTLLHKCRHFSSKVLQLLCWHSNDCIVHYSNTTAFRPCALHQGCDHTTIMFFWRVPLNDILWSWNQTFLFLTSSTRRHRALLQTFADIFN